MKVFGLILIFLSFIASAQETRQEQNALIQKKGFRYYKNDRKLNGKELKQELYKVASAIPYYTKYKTGMVIAYSFVGAGITSLLVSAGSQDNTGFRTAGILLTAGGGLSAVLSLGSLRQAIRKHNDNPPLVY